MQKEATWISVVGTNRRLEDGQSMSALPGYFRHQLVPLLPKQELTALRFPVRR
jgi:hypothetical protein